MRTRWSSVLATAGLLLGAAGCFFEPYREVVRYDLPVTREIATPLAAQEFTDLSGAGTAYRSVAPDGRVTDDADCKWIRPPGELVPRALNRCFRGDGSQRLTGAIDTFAESEGTFICAGTFRIDGQNRRFRFTAPVEGTTPAARAQAAARCVEMLAAAAAEKKP